MQRNHIGKRGRGLPRSYAPSRSSQARLYSHGLYYIFYLGIAVFVFFAHEMFGWSQGVTAGLAGVWLVLVVLMARADAQRVLAAEVTRRALRLRHFWGWREYPWERIRGFLFTRPEDGKPVVVKVVPKYADGRLPRFTTLLLTTNRRLRIDSRAIQNTGRLLDDIEWMLAEIAKQTDEA